MRVTRNLSRGGVVVMAASLAVFGAALPASASPNLLVGGSFNHPLVLPAVTACAPAPVSVGQWQVIEGNAGGLANETTTPTHASAHSLDVRGEASSSPQCGVYGVYQDLPSGSIPASTSFKLSFWMNASQGGTQSQMVIYGWVNRDNGGPTFGVTEDLTNNTITSTAWGTSITVSETFATNTWYHLTLLVNATNFKSTLKVGNTVIAHTPAGSAFPAAQPTVFIGQAATTTPDATIFYYDTVDVSL
jgi:hypothetical protein